MACKYPEIEDGGLYQITSGVLSNIAPSYYVGRVGHGHYSTRILKYIGKTDEDFSCKFDAIVNGHGEDHASATWSFDCDDVDAVSPCGDETNDTIYAAIWLCERE